MKVRELHNRKGSRQRPLLASPLAGISALLVGLLCGCAHVPPACDTNCVSGKINQRMEYSVGTAPCNGSLVLPNGASLQDGLTEEEAVIIALWNNAAFQEQLADLGIANGDLVQAGLLPNPEVVYFFEVPDKPFKYAFDFPLEALWLRPIRVQAAARESDRVCQRLTQSALDLIRDVRQAYADSILAQGRMSVANDAVRIRGDVARMAEARLQAGDVSVQEVTTARIDSLQAQQDAARIGYDTALADERLRNLLAIGDYRLPLTFKGGPPPLRADLDAEGLTADAVGSRPDVLAAQENAAAAAERLRLSKLSWVRFLGIGDATSGRGTGHEFGPAFRATLPILNWNQGNIARAEADLEKAQRQQFTVRNQVILDVHQSHFRYSQARSEMEILDTKVRPEAEAAIRRAEVAYREGNTSYIVVLETTRQLLDSRLRQFQLQAELRRSWADLERSVGHRLAATSTPEQIPPPGI